jgi:[lysine-biosynthesis-protein LysW]--L-2-aminoadipate ligase
MVKIGVIINTMTFEAREIMNAATKYFPDVKMEVFKNDDMKFDITSDNGLNADDADVDVFLQRSLSFSRANYSSFILENYGYRSICSAECLNITNDKLLTTQALQKAHIPTPRTFVAFTKEAALDAIHELGYPVILKPIIGSWGRLVALLENEKAAVAILEDREELGSFYHKIFYIQDYIDKPSRSLHKLREGEGVARDIRAFVIGDEVVSAMERYEIENDWRSNMSLGGKAEAIKITPELEDIAIKAAQATKGEIVGIDLMETEKTGYVVIEVNGTPQFQGILKSTGINVPKRIVEYAVSQAKQ